jgi:hypothetical protein
MKSKKTWYLPIKVEGFGTATTWGETLEEAIENYENGDYEDALEDRMWFVLDRDHLSKATSYE